MADEITLNEAIATATSLVNEKHSIPGLCYVWLDGEHVTASDGATLLKLACPTDFTGGLEGKLVSQILKNNGETEYKVKDNKLSIKVGTSTTRLTLLDINDSIDMGFKTNSQRPGIPVSDLDPKALNGLMNLSFSGTYLTGEVGPVVAIPGSERLSFYMTNRASITRYNAGVQWEPEPPPKRRVVIPSAFLKCLLKCWPRFQEGTLHFGKGGVYVLTSDGHCLYGRNQHAESQLDFAQAMGRLWPDGKIDSSLLLTIPEGLQDALKRAQVLVGNDGVVTFDIYNDVLTIRAETKRGEFSESLVLERECEGLEVTMSVSKVLKALPHVTRFYLSTEGLALHGPSKFSYYIAPTQA